MNPALTVLPATDPADLLRYRDGQYGAELIAAALLHFDFFSWIDAHPTNDSAELARHFGMAARPLDVLLTLCRANGFLVTGGEDRHRLTELGTEHLVKGSPWFLGPYFAPIRDTPVVHGFLQVLRGGPPGNWQAKAGAKDWHESMLDGDFARDFTDLMNSRGMIFGQFLAKALTPYLGGRKQLLDVGGGSGIYSSTMVAAHPGLAATVLEQPPVDAIVRKEIARHGLTDRVGVASGDMFAMAWPAADVVLLSNVLHDWDLPEVRLLLEKAAEALGPDGLLVIHDAFIRDDKSGPVTVAEYSALLMNITRGKCYSAAEYGAVLREAGFEPGSYQDTVGHRGFMTALRQ